MRLLCFALLLLITPAVAGAKPPGRILQRIENLYYAGKLDEALPLIHQLRGSGNLSEAQRIRALRFQAFILFLLALPHEARAAWEELLALDPGHTLSADEASPEFLAFFGAIAPPAGDPSGPADAATTAAPAGAPPGTAEPIATVAAEPERGCGILLCLIPAGVGQFANGQVVKGVIFAALQAAALAVNLGLYWDRYGELTANDGLFADADAAEAKLVAQRVAFVGIFVLVAAGIGDAFLFY